MDPVFAQSSSSATTSSRSPSPATPEPYDTLEQVTIADLSWPSGKGFHPVHHIPTKTDGEDILEFHDLIREGTYDHDAPYECSLMTPLFAANYRSNTNESLPSGSSPTASDTPPNSTVTKGSKQRQRRRELPSQNPPNVVTPPKEACEGLAIVLPNIPATGTKSRVETQIRVTMELANAHASALDPLRYDLVGSWKYLRLPKGTATKRRPRKDGRIDPKPEDTLYLRFEVTCASPPNVPVVSCASCRSREAKRSARKLQMRVRPVRSDSDSGEEGGPGLPRQTEDTTSVVQFNCPEVLEFSSGTTILPVRMTCYCRHHREKVGFLVRFSLLDHQGRLIGSGTTPPIMITDDHKTTSASAAKQASPLVPSSNAPWSTPPEDSPAPPAKRKATTKGNAETKKRAKPYDRNLKSRKGSASGLASPASFTSELPETRSGSPSQLANVPTPLSGVWPQQTASPNALPSVDPASAVLLATPDMLSTVLENLASPTAFLPTAPPSPVQPSLGFQQQMTMSSTVAPSSSFLYFDPTSNLQNLPQPIIHRLIPSSGPTAGGIEITILGANFHPNIQLNCMFGDVVASSTQRWSDNTLLCILPPRITSGVVAVWFEGIEKLEDGSPPVLFTYIDETDRALMELALQVVGLKMTGKLEDAKNVALRIVGTAGDPQQDNVMQVDPTTSDPSRAAQALLFRRARDAEDFETLMVDFLSILDTPVEHATCSSLASAMSHASATGHTLLHLASMRGFSRLTEFLVKHDLDLDARDNNGFTALHYAALVGCAPCAQILLRVGADHEVVNAKGMIAAQLGPEGFFDEILVEVDGELQWARAEDDDEEADWGDGEEDEEDIDPSPAMLRQRRSSRRNPESHIPTTLTPTCEEVPPSTSVSQCPEKNSEVSGAKLSYADVIQRTLMQWQRNKGLIANLPQLPLPPLPQLSGMSSVQWSQLPPMPMVFPVVTPSANWPTFLNANTVQRGKGKQTQPTPENASTGEHQQRPNVKEWLALWEQWMVQAMTAAAAASTAGPKAEDVPPPYSPRTKQPTQEASTSQGLTRRVGYRDEPLPEQEVESYVYKRDGGRTSKMQKKEDRMLVIFWIPMLFIGFWYTFFMVVQVVFNVLKTFLTNRTGIHI
ncbi:hypothetical protein PUNSTDRAFT_142125 [Punctularia strigosozonata HHB-11173 SS5]|uniref:uncharacterized protein n=1 Tax=Punctularia strigosozonata (strain HHB-11173) TaxID=741275 RepID=UPI000441717D|nr:uncharacterized protein PUNSTDRAFT_142125 [Punctularia strigosozonata HHB-11173 SS5]EIN11915.1 hypothetical protein PUNSTDRAFT_142125 [Punctularia strigosozonata HHB-11173 SS5]